MCLRLYDTEHILREQIVAQFKDQVGVGFFAGDHKTELFELGPLEQLVFHDGSPHQQRCGTNENSPGNVKALIDAGAELNATDDDGWTALMHSDEVEVVRLLVNAGADLTIKNKDGLTALGMARKYEQTDVVKLLESRGAPE